MSGTWKGAEETELALPRPTSHGQTASSGRAGDGRRQTRDETWSLGVSLRDEPRKGCS